MGRVGRSFPAGSLDNENVERWKNFLVFFCSKKLFFPPPLPPPTCFRIRNLTLNTVKIQEIVSIDFTGEGEEEGEGKGSGKNVAKR